ncbi:2Fe-2S iron-sulfur cluster-binding protein [Paracoccus tegillarcae]|uniref:Aldehyde dehydrogenase iron-sulfur subunit n=1 Tax=Paracoccus tegillarcae TaxID=1529068 RepID=A0A2K9EFY3_9RHOB|nr:2Fe-2S iron-sulfur cluster-binding protein [Paracoccus tegillarcae]AUH33853.1 aldehyde dehydrogenase iron-sulfur subunit [Paracoccus tegillarcae]
MSIPTRLTIDGEAVELALDPRETLLDTLRDRLDNFSAKKGCDHGQCGACTVLLDGQRVLSCLCLAVSHDGADVVTAGGLGQPGDLHPMQQAFIDHDGLQCGYCTPGQICSAVGMLREFAQGMPSHVTPDINTAPTLSDDEIRERMSGNLCRCGAYANILTAIRETAEGDPV